MKNLHSANQSKILQPTTHPHSSAMYKQGEQEAHQFQVRNNCTLTLIGKIISPSKSELLRGVREPSLCQLAAQKYWLFYSAPEVSIGSPMYNTM